MCYDSQGSLLSQCINHGRGIGVTSLQVWRAMVEGRDIMRQGLIKQIGNGRSTRIWQDNWIPRDSTLRPVACLSPNLPSFVSELIDKTTATWRWNMLQYCFIASECLSIAAIPLCMSNREDGWAWSHEKKGKFSVRSAYRMLVNTKKIREYWLEGHTNHSNTKIEAKAWKTLSNVPVPGKIRHFLWRLVKQSIPCEDVRMRRNMTDSDGCQLCGMQDSWRHSLLQCNVARCVWGLAGEGIVEHLMSSNEPYVKRWLFSLIDTLNHDKVKLIFTTLWAIWHAEMKKIHEDTHQSPFSTHMFVRDYLQEKTPQFRRDKQLILGTRGCQ